MSYQGTELIFAGIGMRIKVNHGNFALPTMICNTSTIGRCDRVISPKNHRNLTRPRNLLGGRFQNF
jgi:hypothetical protein